MPMYLKITDGTTTLDLLGNSAADYFNLEGGNWGPAVATRRKSVMGNQSPYNDVVETIPLYVQSSTDAATVLDNINTLAALIDQAERWYKGDAVDPVVIHYSPNSASVYYEAVILGPPDGQQGVILPPNFVDDLYQNLVENVTLTFKRRGLWLGSEESKSSSAASPPAVMTTATFTNERGAFAPVDIELSVTPSSSSQDYSAFYVFSDGNDKLAFIEAESGAYISSSFSTHADSGASGNNVAKCATGSATKSIYFSSISINSAARKFQVLAFVRNNSSTINYEMYASFYNQYYNPPETAHVNVSGSGAHFVNLGLLTSKEALNAMLVYAKPSASVTSGHEIEIDYIIILAVDDDYCAGVISVPELVINSTNFPSEMHIKHALVDDVAPLYYQVNAGNKHVGRQGNLLLGMKTDVLKGIIVGVPSGSGWTIPGSYTMTVTRRPGYLVPQ